MKLNLIISSLCLALSMEALTPISKAQAYEIIDLASDPIIVGLDGDSTVSYTGGTGLLSAIDVAVSEGASKSNPIPVYIKPGDYTTGNFAIPDGVNLVGLTDSNFYTPGTDAPVCIYADYTTFSSVTSVLQNISFLPVSLTNAAQNVSSSTVECSNCYLGNLNASVGTCIISCANSCIQLPASTSGTATFTFTNCVVPTRFDASSAPVTATFINSTIPDEFEIFCESSLVMDFYESTCGNIIYSNSGSLMIIFEAGSTYGTVTNSGGTDATITYK